MMPTNRFERQLPALLTELAEPRTPDYLDDLLRQTANSSQRPAWSFLERWLPMVDIARRPVLVSRLPWRTIGVGLVLMALLVALVAALVAGGRTSLPLPFGPARNGLVAYASAGDIYTVDPATGQSTAIVRGPQTDINPRWSRDGTRLAFERKIDGDAGPGLLYVARADGSGLIQVTPEPVSGINDYAFSPNGKQILISASALGVDQVLIVATDGSQIRRLELPGPATNAAWRPPDGSEILFMDAGSESNGYGSIYAVSVEGGTVRTILERTAGRYRGYPMWSPDGSRIAYIEWIASDNVTAQTHIIAADGTADRILPNPPDAVWQAARGWSNDGTRLLAIRGYTNLYQNTRAVAIPADGSGVGREIQYPGAIQAACCSVWEWAPDDSSILGAPTSATGALLAQVLLDPVAGTSRTLPWTSVSEPSWQRLAP